MFIVNSIVGECATPAGGEYHTPTYVTINM